MRKKLLIFASLFLVWVAGASAQTIYLSENFDAGVLPSGWSNTAGGSTSAVWSFGNNGGNNINGTSMAFWDDDAAGWGSFGDRPVLTTPIINLGSATTPLLEFTYNFRSWGGSYLTVEVYNGSSWQQVLYVDYDDCGDWFCTPKPKVSIDVSSYKNANFRVRFIYDDDNDWAWYAGIDDVVVKEKPTCFDPINTSVSNVTTTTARINWTTTNGAGRTYEVEYGIPGFVPGSGTRIGVVTGTTVAGANSANITGLTGNTSYHAYVREKCTNPTANSLWVGPISFTTSDPLTFQTNCGVGVSISAGSCPTYEEVSLSVSGLPNKLDGEELEVKSVSVVVTANNWASQIRLALRSPNGTEVPLFSRPYVSFGSHIGNPNGGCQENALCTFTSNAAVQINSTTAPIPNAPYIGTWKPVGRLTDFHTGQNPNGTWKLLGCESGFWVNGTIQYFRIRFSDCFNPENLTLTNISPTQATFSFNSRQQNKSYEIEYGAPGFVPGTGTQLGKITGTTVKGINTATTPNNLTSNTNYQAYVRAVCSGSSRSDWVGPLNFKTSFVVTNTVSFYEGFDGCALPFAWSNTFQPGIADPWLITNGTTFPEATFMTGGSRSGTGCFAWVDDSAPGNAGAEAYLLTQPFDLTGVTLPELNFYWQNSNGGTKFPASIPNPNGVPPIWSELYVDVTTDMGQTFTEIAKFGGVEQSGWKLEALDVSQYKSPRTQFRFRSRETNSFYSDLALDDITIKQSPDMTYSGSNTTQNLTLAIVRGEQDDQILGIEIDTDNGFSNPLAVTSFTFNTNGTTNPADISNAKVYYTGNSPKFSPVNRFGSIVNNPNGTFTVNGIRLLTRGKNYFWLTYDVAPNATLGNVVDAECTSVTVGGIPRTPTTTAPSGSRIIVGKIIYITTTGAGNNDGTSWSNALGNLSSALSVVVPKQEIWVAQGKYFTGVGRNSTFTLVDGVTMYGGFVGNETSINQRSWRANQTILSGDVGISGNVNDNAYHVVTIPTGVSAVLDGFVIEDGNANGLGDNRFAGGIYPRPGSNVIVRNCWVRNNRAIFGAGLLALDASPVIQTSIFEGNTSTSSGGAVYGIGQTQTFTIERSIFINNTCGAFGGVFQSEGALFLVSNCVFSTNRTTSPTGRGTVASLLNGGRARFNHCSSVNNNNGGSAQGDFLAVDGANGGSWATVRNSILWNRSNIGNEIVTLNNGTVTVTSSIIDQDDYISTGRNQNVDPLFRDANGPDNIFGTPDDNLNVRSGSLAIDSADIDTSLPDTYDGLTRDSRPDIGAYEFFPCPVPTDLRVVKLGPTSAEVAWQTGGSNVWNIEYMPAGGALGTGTRVNNITSNPFKITGLQPLTSYQFFVQDNCASSGNGTSFWVGPFVFTTSPINDECDGAIDLIVSSTCNSIVGSNVGATNSTPTVGFPGTCANFKGGDVWFKTTVPSSGSVTFITSFSGGIRDGGMEVYRGDCSGLTSLGCNNDGNLSSPGFEQITVTGQTPGDPIYVRVWENGGDAFGTFNICATRIPVVLVNDVEATENSGVMTFTLRLSEPDNSKSISYNYAITGVTATDNIDFVAASGTVTFPPGSLTRTISVAIIDDNINEDPEELKLTLSNPVNGLIGRNTITGVIRDDDPLPKLSVSGATVIEGNSGVQTVNVTVSMNTVSGRDVRFAYRTTSNSASASEGDFQLIAKTNDILPKGTTSKVYQVRIFGDKFDEGDGESFYFTLEDVNNADLVTPQAEIYITDDDSSPVSRQDDNYSVDEDGIFIVDKLTSAVGANDSDADGDPLTFSIVATTSRGRLIADDTLTLPNGTKRYMNFADSGFFAYIPDKDYWSDPSKGDVGDAFIYRSSDGYNFSNPARAIIKVQPVNDAPIIRGVPDQSLCAGQQSQVEINLPLYIKDVDDNILSPNFVVSHVVTNVTPGLSPADLSVIINPLSKVATFASNVNTQGAFTVAITVRDAEGLSSSDTFKLFVGSDLTASFIYSGACAGTTATLRSTSSSVDGSIQYTYWDFDNDGNFDDEGFSVQHIFRNAGANRVRLRVINEFGCIKDFTTDVNVLPPFAVTITQNRNQLTASAGATYQWFYEGKPIPASEGGTKQTITISKLGIYKVVATNDQGCSATSADINVTTLSVEDISNTVKLYPNPAQSYSMIEMENDLRGIVAVTVTDMLGKVVDRLQTEKSGQSLLLKINMANYASGLYIVQLRVGNHVAVQKLEKN